MSRNLLFTLSFILLTGCGIITPNFQLDPGLDGCVSVHIEELTGGPVHGKGITYHRINEKCKDIPMHPGGA